MTSNSDQNLLFGIIALQMDFVRQDQLVAATSTWLADNSQQVDEILVEQGALSEEDRQLLAPLVARHVENHGGDAQRSLTALSIIGSVADELRSLGDDGIEATLSIVRSNLRDLHTETVIHDSVGSSTASPVSRDTKDARFRVLCSHAKGGLGEVYVAKDTELNRDVALKEIQTKYADDENSRSRFLLEAEVTGGLEHPGIVPVYGLGRYDDGRPFYAMRFIKGDSLQEAAARFHGRPPAEAKLAAENQGSGPDFNSLEFKLLGRFIDVCQAIEYAHSRGVLHRDLKPGNIMLGKYGETLVVDWGLAKAQGPEDGDKRPGETILRPASASGRSPTMMGSAIGTPAFMPPEQASGDLDRLGPASDVYSLGATLYYLLTGFPPFRGQDLTEVLARVKSGRFPSPRSVQPLAPKALAAVCRQAMALSPDARYQTPLALAEDIERYLADEPVTAFREPVLVRARRWVRKHQTIAVTGTTVALLTVLGLSVLSVIVSGKNAELSVLNDSLADKNDELDQKNVALKDAIRREQAARSAAESNALAAQQQGRLALSTLAAVIDDVAGGLRDLPGGNEVRGRLLATSMDKLELVSKEFVQGSSVDRETITALLQMSSVLMNFANVDDSAPSADESRSALRLAETYSRRALEIAERLAAESEDVETQLDLASCHSTLAMVLRRAGDNDSATASFRHTASIAEQLYIQEPDNPLRRIAFAAAVNQLGESHLEAGRQQEALAQFQRTLALEKWLDAEPGPEFRRSMSVTYVRLGEISMQLAETDRAQDYFERALQLHRRQAAEEPESFRAEKDVAASTLFLARCHFAAGRMKEATTHAENAAAIIERLSSVDPHDYEVAQHFTAVSFLLAKIAMQSGRLRDATEHFSKVVENARDLAANDPADSLSQANLATLLGTLGELHLQLGEGDLARTHLMEAIAVTTAFEERGSLKMRTRMNLVTHLSRLGDLYRTRRRLDDAVETYQEALRRAERIVAIDPQSLEGQNLLLAAYGQVGNALLESGKPAEALAYLNKSHDRLSDLTADGGGDRFLRLNLAIVCERMGTVCRELGRRDEAALHFQRSIDVAERIIAANATDARARHVEAQGWVQLGDLSLDADRPQDALERFRELHDRMTELASMAPDHAEFQRMLFMSHQRLAYSHRELQEWALAATQFRKAAQVLANMIDRGQLESYAREQKAIAENDVRQVELAAIALGEWDALQEQSEEILPDLLERRAILMVDQSNFQQAAQAATKLGQIPTSTARHRFLAAKLLCRCVKAFRSDARQPEAEDTTLQEQWIADAIATLKQAIAAGWDDFDNMQEDEDLATIRDRPEFKALIPESD